MSGRAGAGSVGGGAEHMLTTLVPARKNFGGFNCPAITEIIADIASLPSSFDALASLL